MGHLAAHPYHCGRAYTYAYAYDNCYGYGASYSYDWGWWAVIGTFFWIFFLLLLVGACYGIYDEPAHAGCVECRQDPAHRDKHGGRRT